MINPNSDKWEMDYLGDEINITSNPIDPANQNNSLSEPELQSFVLARPISSVFISHSPIQMLQTLGFA